jgi:hypothetical protein
MTRRPHDVARIILRPATGMVQSLLKLTMVLRVRLQKCGRTFAFRGIA